MKWAASAKCANDVGVPAAELLLQYIAQLGVERFQFAVFA